MLQRRGAADPRRDRATYAALRRHASRRRMLRRDRAMRSYSSRMRENLVDELDRVFEELIL